MRLRALREKAGLSRPAFLRRLAPFELSEVALWKYETDRVNPSIDRVLAMAGALGCKVEELAVASR